MDGKTVRSRSRGRPPPASTRRATGTTDGASPARSVDSTDRSPEISSMKTGRSQSQPSTRKRGRAVARSAGRGQGRSPSLTPASSPASTRSDRMEGTSTRARSKSPAQSSGGASTNVTTGKQTAQNTRAKANTPQTAKARRKSKNVTPRADTNAPIASQDAANTSMDASNMASRDTPKTSNDTPKGTPKQPGKNTPKSSKHTPIGEAEKLKMNPKRGRGRPRLEEGHVATGDVEPTEKVVRGKQIVPKKTEITLDLRHITGHSEVYKEAKYKSKEKSQPLIGTPHAPQESISGFDNRRTTARQKGPVSKATTSQVSEDREMNEGSAEEYETEDEVETVGDVTELSLVEDGAESMDTTEPACESQAETIVQEVKRSRGRPKGSKNVKYLLSRKTRVYTGGKEAKILPDRKKRASMLKTGSVVKTSSQIKSVSLMSERTASVVKSAMSAKEQAADNTDDGARQNAGLSTVREAIDSHTVKVPKPSTGVMATKQVLKSLATESKLQHTATQQTPAYMSAKNVNGGSNEQIKTRRNISTSSVRKRCEDSVIKSEFESETGDANIPQEQNVKLLKSGTIVPTMAVEQHSSQSQVADDKIDPDMEIDLDPERTLLPGAKSRRVSGATAVESTSGDQARSDLTTESKSARESGKIISIESVLKNTIKMREQLAKARMRRASQDEKSSPGAKVTATTIDPDSRRSSEESTGQRLNMFDKFTAIKERMSETSHDEEESIPEEKPTAAVSKKASRSRGRPKLSPGGVGEKNTDDVTSVVTKRLSRRQSGRSLTVATQDVSNEQTTDLLAKLSPRGRPRIKPVHSKQIEAEQLSSEKKLTKSKRSERSALVERTPEGSTETEKASVDKDKLTEKKDSRHFMCIHCHSALSLRSSLRRHIRQKRCPQQRHPDASNVAPQVAIDLEISEQFDSEGKGFFACPYCKDRFGQEATAREHVQYKRCAQPPPSPTFKRSPLKTAIFRKSPTGSSLVLAKSKTIPLMVSQLRKSKRQLKFRKSRRARMVTSKIVESIATDSSVAESSQSSTNSGVLESTSDSKLIELMLEPKLANTDSDTLESTRSESVGQLPIRGLQNAPTRGVFVECQPEQTAPTMSSTGTSKMARRMRPMKSITSRRGSRSARRVKHNNTESLLSHTGGRSVSEGKTQRADKTDELLDRATSNEQTDELADRDQIKEQIGELPCRDQNKDLTDELPDRCKINEQTGELLDQDKGKKQAAVFGEREIDGVRNVGVELSESADKVKDDQLDPDVNESQTDTASETEQEVTKVSEVTTTPTKLKPERRGRKRRRRNEMDKLMENLVEAYGNVPRGNKDARATDVSQTLQNLSLPSDRTSRTSRGDNTSSPLPEDESAGEECGQDRGGNVPTRRRRGRGRGRGAQARAAFATLPATRGWKLRGRGRPRGISARGLHIPGGTDRESVDLVNQEPPSDVSTYIDDITANDTVPPRKMQKREVSALSDEDTISDTEGPEQLEFAQEFVDETSGLHHADYFDDCYEEERGEFSLNFNQLDTEESKQNRLAETTGVSAETSDQTPRETQGDLDGSREMPDLFEAFEDKSEVDTIAKDETDMPTLVSHTKTSTAIALAKETSANKSVILKQPVTDASVNSRGGTVTIDTKEQAMKTPESAQILSPVQNVANSSGVSDGQNWSLCMDVTPDWKSGSDTDSYNTAGNVTPNRADLSKYSTETRDISKLSYNQKNNVESLDTVERPIVQSTSDTSTKTHTGHEHVVDISDERLGHEQSEKEGKHKVSLHTDSVKIVEHETVKIIEEVSKHKDSKGEHFDSTPGLKSEDFSAKSEIIERNLKSEVEEKDESRETIIEEPQQQIVSTIVKQITDKIKQNSSFSESKHSEKKITGDSATESASEHVKDSGDVGNEECLDAPPSEQIAASAENVADKKLPAWQQSRRKKQMKKIRGKKLARARAMRTRWAKGQMQQHLHHDTDTQDSIASQDKHATSSNKHMTSLQKKGSRIGMKKRSEIELLFDVDGPPSRQQNVKRRFAPVPQEEKKTILGQRIEIETKRAKVKRVRHWSEASLDSLDFEMPDSDASQLTGDPLMDTYGTQDAVEKDDAHVEKDTEDASDIHGSPDSDPGKKMTTRGKKNRYWYLFAKQDRKGNMRTMLSKPDNADMSQYQQYRKAYAKYTTDKDHKERRSRPTTPVSAGARPVTPLSTGARPTTPVGSMGAMSATPSGYMSSSPRDAEMALEFSPPLNLSMQPESSPVVSPEVPQPKVPKLVLKLPKKTKKPKYRSAYQYPTIAPVTAPSGLVPIDRDTPPLVSKITFPSKFARMEENASPVTESAGGTTAVEVTSRCKVVRSRTERLLSKCQPCEVKLVDLIKFLRMTGNEDMIPEMPAPQSESLPESPERADTEESDIEPPILKKVARPPTITPPKTAYEQSFLSFIDKKRHVLPSPAATVADTKPATVGDILKSRDADKVAQTAGSVAADGTVSSETSGAPSVDTPGTSQAAAAHVAGPPAAIGQPAAGEPAAIGPQAVVTQGIVLQTSGQAFRPILPKILPHQTAMLLIPVSSSNVIAPAPIGGPVLQTDSDGPSEQGAVKANTPLNLYTGRSAQKEMLSDADNTLKDTAQDLSLKGPILPKVKNVLKASHDSSSVGKAATTISVKAISEKMKQSDIPAVTALVKAVVRKTTARKQMRSKMAAPHVGHASASQRFRCLCCTYTCSSRTVMSEHIYNHTDIVPYSCGYCGSIFGTRSGVMVHTKRDHTKHPHKIVKNSTMNEEQYYCTMDSFDRMVANGPVPLLTVERMSERNTIATPKLAHAEISKETLDNLYSSNKSLKLWKDISMPETTYQCKYCNFKTIDHNTMEIHVSHTHQKDRRYVCPLCKVSFFKQLDSMKKHIQRWHPGATSDNIEYEPGYLQLKDPGQAKVVPMTTGTLPGQYTKAVGTVKGFTGTSVAKKPTARKSIASKRKSNQNIAAFAANSLPAAKKIREILSQQAAHKFAARTPGYVNIAPKVSGIQSSTSQQLILNVPHMTSPTSHTEGMVTDQEEGSLKITNVVSLRDCPDEMTYMAGMTSQHFESMKVIPDSQTSDKEQTGLGAVQTDDSTVPRDTSPEYMCKEVSSTSEEPIVTSFDSAYSRDSTQLRHAGTTHRQISHAPKTINKSMKQAFQCKICMKILLNFNVAKVHLSQNHYIDFDYQCPYCQYRCSSQKSNNMIRHLATNHGNQSQDVHVGLVNQSAFFKMVDVGPAKGSQTPSKRFKGPQTATTGYSVHEKPRTGAIKDPMYISGAGGPSHGTVIIQQDEPSVINVAGSTLQAVDQPLDFSVKVSQVTQEDSGVLDLSRPTKLPSLPIQPPAFTHNRARARHVATHTVSRPPQQPAHTASRPPQQPAHTVSRPPQQPAHTGPRPPAHAGARQPAHAGARPPPPLLPMGIVDASQVTSKRLQAPPLMRAPVPHTDAPAGRHLSGGAIIQDASSSDDEDMAREAFSVFNVQPPTAHLPANLNIPQPQFYTMTPPPHPMHLRLFPPAQPIGISPHFMTQQQQVPLRRHAPPNVVVGPGMNFPSLPRQFSRFINCPDCAFKNSSYDVMRAHIMSHGKVTWTCPYCPMPQKMTKSVATQHIVNCHPGAAVDAVPFGLHPQNCLN